MTRVFVDLEMNPTAKLKRKEFHLQQEIIEIGAARMDENYAVLDTYRGWVRPVLNEAVDTSIFKLTGITTRMVADAPALPEALELFWNWIGADGGPVKLLTWSESDYSQMARECRVKELETPLLDPAQVRWQDFQRMFSRMIHLDAILSLERALDAAGLQQEGTQHDALDDAANCAHLLALAKDRPEFERRMAYVKNMILRKAPERASFGLGGQAMAALQALSGQFGDD